MIFMLTTQSGDSDVPPIVARHLFAFLALGPDFDLSTDPTTQRRAPAAAYNGVTAEYLVVWFDTRNPGNNDVFGQRISAGGALLGSNLSVFEGTGSQSDPALAHSPVTNEYLVTWRSQTGNPGSPGFNHSFGRLVAADGTPLTAEIDI